MDNTPKVKEPTLTVEKKPLVLVLPYVNSISLETRTKMKKQLLEAFLNVVNYKWYLKIRSDQVMPFISKIVLPKILSLVPLTSFGVDSAMSTIIVGWEIRALRVRMFDEVAIFVSSVLLSYTCHESAV